jgi:hypothetical protein
VNRLELKSDDERIAPKEPKSATYWATISAMNAMNNNMNIPKSAASGVSTSRQRARMSSKDSE